MFLSRKRTFVAKVINTIMRKGLQAKAESLFLETLLNIKRITRKHPLPIVRAAVKNTEPFAQVKVKKIAGKPVNVPQYISEFRSRFKAVSWLVSFAKRRTERSFPLKFAKELVAASRRRGLAVREKNRTHALVLASRGNMRYRKPGGKRRKRRRRSRLRYRFRRLRTKFKNLRFKRKRKRLRRRQARHIQYKKDRTKHFGNLKTLIKPLRRKRNWIRSLKKKTRREIRRRKVYYKKTRKLKAKKIRIVRRKKIKKVKKKKRILSKKKRIYTRILRYTKLKEKNVKKGSHSRIRTLKMKAIKRKPILKLAPRKLRRLRLYRKFKAYNMHERIRADALVRIRSLKYAIRRRLRTYPKLKRGLVLKFKEILKHKRKDKKKKKRVKGPFIRIRFKTKGSLVSRTISFLRKRTRRKAKKTKFAELRMAAARKGRKKTRRIVRMIKNTRRIRRRFAPRLRWRRRYRRFSRKWRKLKKRKRIKRGKRKLIYHHKVIGRLLSFSSAVAPVVKMIKKLKVGKGKPRKNQEYINLKKK